MQKVLIGIGFVVLVLVGSVLYAQDPSRCPDRLPDRTSCFSGRDDNGAYYLIAIPKNWNGTLLLFNHGQSLSPPAPITTADALGPAILLVPEGFAVAASTFRSGGFGVGESAEDTENLRQVFIRRFGRPKRTIVEGLSYGGLVTAKVAELYGVNPDGSLNYDGAFAHCGLLAGGLTQFYVRLDTRVVYQYYCQNHPRPDEEQYDLYRGLPKDTPMTQQELTARVNECTGVLLLPWQRSERQRRNLANIVNVMGVPESALINPLMTSGTFVLQNITEVRLGGRNPFSNVGVQYRGSDDDAALNAGVLRYGAEPEVREWFSADSDPTGDVSIPVLTMHAIDDPGVFVEYEAAYREKFEEAGTLDFLFQTYTNGGGHCGFTNSEYATAYHALLDWIETGDKPAQEEIVVSCDKYRLVYRDQCRFNPTYKPGPLTSRVYPREP